MIDGRTDEASATPLRPANDARMRDGGENAVGKTKNITKMSTHTRAQY